MKNAFQDEIENNRQILFLEISLLLSLSLVIYVARSLFIICGFDGRALFLDFIMSSLLDFNGFQVLVILTKRRKSKGKWPNLQVSRNVLNGLEKAELFPQLSKTVAHRRVGVWGESIALDVSHNLMQVIDFVWHEKQMIGLSDFFNGVDHRQQVSALTHVTEIVSQVGMLRFGPIACPISEQVIVLVGKVELDLFNVIDNDVQVSGDGPVVDQNVTVLLLLHQVAPFLFIVDVVQVAIVGPNGRILVPGIAPGLNVLHHDVSGRVQVDNQMRSKHPKKGHVLGLLVGFASSSFDPSLIVSGLEMSIVTVRVTLDHHSLTCIVQMLEGIDVVSHLFLEDQPMEPVATALDRSSRVAGKVPFVVGL